jgi:hypothetical protein
MVEEIDNGVKSKSAIMPMVQRDGVVAVAAAPPLIPRRVRLVWPLFSATDFSIKGQ